VLTIQSRYRIIGVTPVRPPQPVESTGPVAQLITTSTASRSSLVSKTTDRRSRQQHRSHSVLSSISGRVHLLDKGRSSSSDATNAGVAAARLAPSPIKLNSRPFCSEPRESPHQGCSNNQHRQRNAECDAYRGSRCRLRHSISAVGPKIPYIKKRSLGPVLSPADLWSATAPRRCTQGNVSGPFGSGP
jgi:hypothetical protein